MKQQKYWDTIADEYDATVAESGDVSQRLIINPLVKQLLGDLQGKVVLDAGCGNGYWSRKLAIRAHKVMGVDFTPALIEKAKLRGVPANVEFLVGNLEKMPFPSESFDTVLLNMVLLDVEKLLTVMKEIARVTKKQGTVIVSTTHPCFENPPNTTSLRNEQREKTGRLVSNYFLSGLVEDKQNKYEHYHHTLSEFLNSFASCSLFVDRVEEPNGAEIIQNGEVDHTPYFLIVRLRKL